MTALDTVLGNFGPTTTLLLETQTTQQVMKETNDQNEKITTLVLAASTILDQIEVPSTIVRINDTLSYVESLTDEELARADQLLSGIKFATENDKPVIEQPKVYVKSSEQNII